MPPASSLFRRSEAGLFLHLRVTPNAGRDAIDGAETRDDRQAVLLVRVSALPDKGKANAAVIALLAKALGVPKSSISIISGETSRMKVLAVAGEPKALAERIEAMACAGAVRRN